jgi:hypothetical protein
MKEIYLELKEGFAIISNKEPVYLEKSDKVKFIINNANNKKLAYVNKAEVVNIKGNSFTLDYNQIKNTMFIRVLCNDELYVLRDLKVHEVKVIGDTIDEKYPEVLQEFNCDIKDIKQAIVNIFDILFELGKDGVVR